jgi:hypothetical protein
VPGEVEPTPGLKINLAAEAQHLFRDSQEAAK